MGIIEAAMASLVIGLFHLTKVKLFEVSLRMVIARSAIAFVELVGNLDDSGALLAEEPLRVRPPGTRINHE